MKMLRGGIICLLALGTASSSWAEPAFKIGGKTTDVKELYKEDESSFYKIEKDKYELIEQLAKQKYLDYYWSQEAKKKNTSVEAVQNEYFEKNAKISEKEIKETQEKFKDHPELKKLSKEEQEKQIREFLRDRAKRDVIMGILAAGQKKGDLQIVYPKPSEPVYKIAVSDTDNVRYGPGNDDIKPMGCKDDCKITVVEFNEFQCPFCSRVIPTVKQLLTEYKGKVRWVVRDFPLDFHPRARPAAIAAHCAGKQNKYWHMYSTLFDNQQNLNDPDLEKYAGSISGLDKGKWQACVKNPAEVLPNIDKNFESGRKLGVSGTPAFFINGRKIAGALPYEEFKRVFDKELGSKKS